MLIRREKKSIFEKLISIIKGLFSKKEEKLVIVNTQISISNNSFISRLKEERYILDLQKRYESGEVKEKDLTEKEKSKLMDLYDKQIRDLKIDIENYNKSSKYYKEKILEIKKKLNNQ